MREISTIRRDVIIIGVASIVSQGFLLIVTGTFWDDWFYYYRDRESLWVEFLEAGRPSSAYWVEAVWDLPHYGYRWLVFVLFTFTAIILYLIMRNSKTFSAEEVLWLSVLYTVIPVNDGRIILCTFSYAVGLTSFFIGGYIFQKYLQSKENKRKLFLRIIALFFFGYSFIIQSILIYYAIVLLYIFSYEYQNRKRFLNAIKAMFIYIDFVLLPVVFYVGKQLMFPTYGQFVNYNVVTMKAVLIAGCRLPLAVIKQAERNWIEIFSFAVPSNIVVLLTIPIIVIALIRAVVWNKNAISHGFDVYVGGVLRNTDVQKLLLGIILFALGLYPYNVVRGSDEVCVAGVDSRDSLLLAPGMALMLYYFFKLLFANQKIRKTIYIVLVLCCSMSCNFHYLNYQRDAYWQKVLINKLQLNEEIREAHNLLFLSDDSNGIGGTRFYTLNGASSVAYGDQTRLILTEATYGMLFDREQKSACVASGRVLMNEYDVSNNVLDGVIVYDCDIDYRECILLKINELFDDSNYYELIDELGELNYYPADSQQAIELIGEMRIQ